MKLFDVRVSKKFVTSLSITDHLPPSTAGYLGDLLRAEPDLHEHGALLRHRVPPQVPLSVHRLSSKVSLLKKHFGKKRGFCSAGGWWPWPGSSQSSSRCPGTGSRSLSQHSAINLRLSLANFFPNKLPTLLTETVFVSVGKFGLQ